MKPHVKYGIIGGIASIIWNLIMYLTGIDRTDAAKPLGWVIVVLLIVFAVLAIKEQRNMNKGYITYGGAFKSSFLTILIAAVIGCAYFYIHMTLIDPGMQDFMKQKAQDEMAKKSMTDEQIDQAMKFTNMFLSPAVLSSFAFVFDLILGAIASLIIGAIMKKEPPPGEVLLQ